MRLLPAPLVLLAACGTDFGVDEDGDGFPTSVDCDDTTAEIFPGADEACDGVDNNCDGRIDAGATQGLTTFYADLDDDGAAGDIITVDACEAPAGFAAEATDCDDLDASAAPDGEEVCDGIDNDCDGDIDEDGEDITWYFDQDGDGFGNDEVTVTACAAPEDYISLAGDCNDNTPNIHPGANETCASPADDNCDGIANNDPVDGSTYFLDLDSDGFAGELQTVVACSVPSGAFEAADDCDDVNSAVFPDAPEVCNGIDDNCDTVIDTDAIDIPTWYADAEGDSYGDPTDTVQACEQPDNYVDNALDCTPSTSENTQPGTQYWVDGDDDGFGAGAPTLYCDDPGNGFADNANDCDDTAPTINPSATEVCDDANVDENCNGLVDDSDDDVDGGIERFLDLDNDGFGTRSIGLFCDDADWYATEEDDCDDDDADRYPGAPITPDGEIGDCNICDGVVINEGDIIINEVSQGRPDSEPYDTIDRPGFEWVEVRNVTNRPLAICEPWELTNDGGSVTILPSADLTIPAGGLFVLGQTIANPGPSTDPTANAGASVDYAYGTSFEFGAWNPQTITLSIDSVVIDTVPFATGGSVYFFGSGISMQLDPDYQNADDNDCMDYWCDGDWEQVYGLPNWRAYGTPGEENPECQSLNGGTCAVGSGSV